MPTKKIKSKTPGKYRKIVRSGGGRLSSRGRVVVGARVVRAGVIRVRSRRGVQD